MQIQPYLFFEDRCDEAIAFYREGRAFGAARLPSVDAVRMLGSARASVCRRRGGSGGWSWMLREGANW